MTHPFLIVFLTSVATTLAISFLGRRSITARKRRASLQAADWRMKRSLD